MCWFLAAGNAGTFQKQWREPQHLETTIVLAERDFRRKNYRICELQRLLQKGLKYLKYLLMGSCSRVIPVGEGGAACQGVCAPLTNLMDVPRALETTAST